MEQIAKGDGEFSLTRVLQRDGQQVPAEDSVGGFAATGQAGGLDDITFKVSSSSNLPVL